MFDYDKPNPYDSRTEVVRWQLWENAKHHNALARTYTIDAGKAHDQWKTLRIKADEATGNVSLFEMALLKLTE